MSALGGYGGLAVIMYAAALGVGYLLGSIPFGLILTKLAGTQDLRSIGSGNIGATNVLRTGRKDLAIATLLLDALKGTAAVLIVSAWLSPFLGVIAGLGAFLGHLFPVWLKFKGGKGVATYIGVLLAIWWPGLVIFAAIWLAVAYFTRYSSLAALVAAAATPLIRIGLDLAGGGISTLAVVFSLMSGLLIWKHSENIARLRAGTEGKIGQKG